MGFHRSSFTREATEPEWLEGSQRDSLVDDVWSMYQTSYAKIGLHLRGSTDMYEYDPWLLFFDNAKPVAFVLFKRTEYGLKLGVIGSDGSPAGKTHVVAWLGSAFEHPGMYGEVSHAVERLTGHAPRVCATDAERVLRKTIDPSADGIHYKRAILVVGTVEKVMVGRPLHVPASIRPMCRENAATDRLECAEAVSFLDEVRYRRTLEEARPSRGLLWTVDYRLVRPDPIRGGYWARDMVAVVRAMSAAEAISKVRILERAKSPAYRVEDVTIEPGHNVPGYPPSAIIGK